MAGHSGQLRACYRDQQRPCLESDGTDEGMAVQRYRPGDQDTGHDDAPDDDELTVDTEGSLSPPGGRRWIISLEAGLVGLAIIVLVAMIVIAAAE